MPLEFSLIYFCSGGPVSKGQEEQKQEKESMEREVTELKTKLTQTVTAYDELERKNMATGAKVDTMAQHLEVKIRGIKNLNTNSYNLELLLPLF